MRALTLLFLLLPLAAAAHGAGEDGDGSARWSLDTWVVLPLGLSLVLWFTGAARLRQRSRVAGQAGAALWFLGWLSLALALCSPLHWYGERVFTAHMIEHEVVMAVSAPLLVLARPQATFAWSLPRPLRRALRRGWASTFWRKGWAFLAAPLVATIAHGIAIWAWHVPPLFEATITSLPLHRLQHLSFLLTALLFWWALLRRAAPGEAAAHLFVTMMHMGLLGALIALAPRVVFNTQTSGSTLWWMTPLEDQQLAGLVMWVPAGTVYAVAALVFLGRWINRAGERADHALGHG